jgi:predicted nucleotidyltransferase
MHVDSKSQIAGVPSLRVREFLLRAEDRTWPLESVAKRLDLSEAQAAELAAELLRLDYIEPTPSDTNYYRRTLAGSAFSQASAARPLTRETARRKLDEFLERVREVNRDDRLAYRVRRVVVFGSYLTERERINDVDVAVDLEKRYADDEDMAVRQARIRETDAAGRQFASYAERVFWPQIEVLLRLKARSRAISLHDFGMEESFLRQTETRVVFEAGSES